MKYYYEGYEILAPLTIASNEPMFDVDTISLKKQRSTQGAQRWELSFGVVTDSPADALISIASFDTVKTMTMPQLNDVNSRIGSSATVNHTVTAIAGKFYIDGVQQKTLSFVKGNTYIFDVSDSSNNTHPFRFSTTSNGTHGGGVEYTTGVTTSGTEGQAGATVTIVVSGSAPSTLYYYCANHSNMGGVVNVSNATGVAYPKGAFVTGSVTGSNNKVYMVKSDAASVVASNLYPTPPSGLTYSTVANATIRYYREVSDLRGITFNDGILASPGTISIIEAL
jgi:hypothetical protein